MNRMLCLVVFVSFVAACKKPEPPKVDGDTHFIQKLGQALGDHTKIFEDENRLGREICLRRGAEIKECADVIPRLEVLPPLPK